MKVNKVLETLESIRNEYGNIEVMVFDTTAWDEGRDDDIIPLDKVSFDGKKKKNYIILERG